MDAGPETHNTNRQGFDKRVTGLCPVRKLIVTTGKF